MRAFITTLVPALLLLLGLPAAVAAEPPPAPQPRRVALLVEPASKRDAAKVTKLSGLIQAAFKKRGFERSRLIAPYDPQALQQAKRELAAVRKAMASDHQLRRAAEHEQALTRVLLGLKAGLGAVPIDDLVEVYRGLASTRLAADDRRMAETYMRAALNLKPDATERDFFGSGKLKDLFRDMQATAGLTTQVVAAVKSKPSGAEVYVGDTFVGTTPLKIDTMKEGTNLIRLRRDGYYSHGWLADPVPGTPQRLVYNLRPIGGKARFEAARKALLSAKAWKRDPAAAAKAGADLQRLFRADDVVVIRVKTSKTGYTLTGAVVPKGKEATQVTVDIPLDANLLKRLDVLTYEWAP